MTQPTGYEFWRGFFPLAMPQEDRIASAGLVQQVPVGLMPRGFDPDSVKLWLLASCRMMEITLTEWAREAKLSPSTLNRFVKGNGPKNLTANTIRVLSDVITFRIMEDEKLDEKYFSSDKIPPIFNIRVVGAFDPRSRREHFEWNMEECFSVSLPLLSGWFSPDIIGIQIRGANNTFRIGSIAIISRINSFHSDYKQGALVLLHSRFGEREAMSSFRRLVVDPNGEPWLVGVEDDRDAAIHLSEFDNNGMSPARFVSHMVLSSIEPAAYLQPKESR